MDPGTKPAQNYPPFTPVLEPQTPVTNVVKRLNFDTAEQPNDNTSIIQPSKKKVKTVASRFMLPPPSAQKPAKKDDRLNASMANSSFANTSFANTSFRAPQPRKTSQMPTTRTTTTGLHDASAISHSVNTFMSRPKVPSQIPAARTATTSSNDTSAISSASNTSMSRSKISSNSTIQPTNKAPSHISVPPGATMNSNNAKIMRHRLGLLQNVLLQYCFCNAKGKKLLELQNERAKKVMLASFNKVHELREEVYRHKLQLNQKQYLHSLDAILTLQENNLQVSHIETTLQHYQTITTSIFASLNLMPLDMQVQPGLIKTIAGISDTLARIQQGIALTERDQGGSSISSAAQSIESIAQSVPQQILLLEDCKLLIKILTGIENQLTSLHIEAIEERLFDEMYIT